MANGEWRMANRSEEGTPDLPYSLLATRYSLFAIRFYSPFSRSPLTTRQPVAAPDHRVAVGRNDAARDQILQMRQHGIAGRAGQPRIDADIDRAHHGRNIRFAFGETMQDRGFAGLTVPDQETHVAPPFRDFRSVAGKIQILLALRQPFQRGHVVDH